MILLQQDPIDGAPIEGRKDRAPTETQPAAAAGEGQGPATDAAEGPAPAPERTTFVQPEELRVDFEVRGRVQTAKEHLPAVQVWLLEFEEPPGVPSGPSSPPELELLDRLDDQKFDLVALERHLVRLADLLAKTSPDGDGSFTIRLPRNVDVARTRLIAFDTGRSECTNATALQRPVTVLVFAEPSDLDVVVSHELLGAKLTVEVLDVDRSCQPARTAPVENGIARFRALPRRSYAFCVRSDDPPLYCATGPVDTKDHRYAIHLALRTQDAPCSSDHHVDEKGGTITPAVESGRRDGRWPLTPRLSLGARCPHCAFLSKGTYAFDRATPKYAFGSFPVPHRIRKDLDRVHVWDEDGVHSFEPRAWLEVR